MELDMPEHVDKTELSRNLSGVVESDNPLQREVELLRDGISRGVVQRVDEMCNDVVGTIGTIGLSTCMGAGLSLASRAGGRWGTAARFAGYGLTAALGVDLVCRAVPTFVAMGEAWRSPDNMEAGKQVVGAMLGTALVDYPIMMAAGYGGLKLAGRTPFVPQALGTSDVSATSSRLSTLLKSTAIASWNTTMGDVSSGMAPKGSIDVLTIADTGRPRLLNFEHLPGGTMSYTTKDGSQILSDPVEFKTTEKKDGKTTTRYYDGSDFTIPGSVVSGAEGSLTVTFPERKGLPGGARHAVTLQIEPGNARVEHTYPDGSKEHRYWNGWSYHPCTATRLNADQSITFRFGPSGHYATGVLDGDRTTLTITNRNGNQTVCKWSAAHNRFLAPGR